MKQMGQQDEINVQKSEATSEEVKLMQQPELSPYQRDYNLEEVALVVGCVSEGLGYIIGEAKSNYLTIVYPSAKDRAFRQGKELFEKLNPEKERYFDIDCMAISIHEDSKSRINDNSEHFWTQFSTEVQIRKLLKSKEKYLLFLISVGQPYHEQEQLDASINLFENIIRSCTEIVEQKDHFKKNNRNMEAAEGEWHILVVVADSLQAYNHASSEEDYKKAISDYKKQGNTWIKKAEPIFQRLEEAGRSSDKTIIKVDIQFRKWNSLLMEAVKKFEYKKKYHHLLESYNLKPISVENEKFYAAVKSKGNARKENEKKQKVKSSAELKKKLVKSDLKDTKYSLKGYSNSASMTHTQWEINNQLVFNFILELHTDFSDHIKPITFNDQKLLSFNFPTFEPKYSVSREDLINKLRHNLLSLNSENLQRKQPIIACHGMGGVGKTHLITEYCHRFMHEYSLTAWISAYSVDSEFCKLAQKLGLANRKLSASDAKDIIKNWLALNPGWLLVFDDIRNDEQIKYIRSLQGGHVILTSRLNDWEQHAIQPIKVNLMSEDEAIKLLERITACKYQKKIYSALAFKLGYLPKGLEVAAKYIREQNKISSFSGKDYLELMNGKNSKETENEIVQPTVSKSHDKPKADLLRRGFSNKGSLNDQDFAKVLPKDNTWGFGKALDNGDCFYDAITQSANYINSAISNNNNHTNPLTVKSAREICSQYLRKFDELSPQTNWIKQEIEKDRGIDDYRAHLATVQYTQEEMAEFKKESNIFTGYAIWGKPQIEGRLLVDSLKLILHVIEFHEPDKSLQMIPPAHILVTDNGVKQVDEADVDYQANRMLHIAVYRNHYVPVLPTSYLTKNLSEQIKDGKKEVTQFNKHSPANLSFSGPILMIFETSLNAIDQPKTNKILLGREILTLCSYLAPHKIPRDLIYNILKSTDNLGEYISSESFNDICKQLLKYSLLEAENLENRDLSIHVLIQDTYRAKKGKKEKWEITDQRNLIYLAAKHLNQLIKETLDKGNGEQFCCELQAHVDTLLGHYGYYSKIFSLPDLSQRPVLMSNLGIIHGLNCDSKQEKKALEAALNLIYKMYGDNFGEETLKVISDIKGNLAACLVSLDQISLAEKLYDEVEEIEKKLVTDPIKLENHNINLSSFYSRLGKHEIAQKLLEQILTARRGRYKEDRPDLIPVLVNLAGVYELLHKDSQAISCAEEAIKIITKYSIHLNYLSALYIILGRQHVKNIRNKEKFDEGINYLEKAREIDEKSLESDNYGHAVTLNNLGSAYEKRGDFELAEKCFLQALEINQNYFSSDSDDSSRLFESFSFLGIHYYYYKGDGEKAIGYLLKAKTISENLVGDHQSLTADTYLNLGKAYCICVDYSKAENCFEVAFQLYLKKNHPKAPATLVALCYTKLMLYKKDLHIFFGINSDFIFKNKIQITSAIKDRLNVLHFRFIVDILELVRSKKCKKSMELYYKLPEQIFAYKKLLKEINDYTSFTKNIYSFFSSHFTQPVYRFMHRGTATQNSNAQAHINEERTDNSVNTSPQ